MMKQWWKMVNERLLVHKLGLAHKGFTELVPVGPGLAYWATGVIDAHGWNVLAIDGVMPNAR